MRSMNLLDDLDFSSAGPKAEPLYVDSAGRILRFCLQPHQSMSKHAVPNSSFYVVIVKGEGIFTDSRGNQTHVRPHSLLLYDPNEEHTVQALDQELVFVGFLQGVTGTRADHIGGKLADD